MNTAALCKERITNFLFKRHFALDTDVSIKDANYVVIDTELTGLDMKKGSIISIGAVKVRGGRIDLNNAFYRLVNPRTEMDSKSVPIHRITPSDVAEKPSIDSVISEFIGFCGVDVLVGHFVLLDMNFINRDMNRIYGTHMKNYMVDTQSIYEWIAMDEGDVMKQHFEVPEATDIFSLAKKYSIPFKKTHNALTDAFITAQIMQRFLSILPEHGVRKLKDLLRIGSP